MLVNVVDLRERQYRWQKIMAVLEAAEKNNEAEDSDSVSAEVGVQIDYAERRGLSVREAMQWAETMQALVTLYLYDLDEEEGGSTEP